MVLDSDYRNPVVREIYSFKDNESYAKEILINEIAGENESKIQKAKSTVEMVFGEGYVNRHSFRDSEAYGRQNGRRKGSNSGRNTEQTKIREWRFDDESGVKYSRETSAEADREYLSAVERGDMETAQRFVDEPSKLKSFSDKGKTSRETVDNYTEKEYNDYGWARYNDVLSASENADLRSKFAAAVSKQAKYPKSSSGEYMIAIGDNVNNKIAYMKGTIENPVITRILEIYEDNETKLDKIRRNIYAVERRGIQQKAGVIFNSYSSASFGRPELKPRSGIQSNRYNEQLGAERGRDSKQTPRPKEYIFGEDGQVIEKHSRELDFVDYLNENADAENASGTENLTLDEMRARAEASLKERKKEYENVRKWAITATDSESLGGIRGQRLRARKISQGTEKRSRMFRHLWEIRRFAA